MKRRSFFEVMNNVVSDMGGVGEVHGVFGIGQINDKGI